MRKKMLITGCCGFVGRHMCKYFSDEYDITGVDNMISESSLYPIFWMDRLKCGFRFIESDIVQFLSDHKDHYDVVIHLAAVVGGRQKIEENPLDVALDLVIDSAVINWCSRNNVDRLLFFSSSAVYPISFQKDNLNSKKLDESMIDFENNIGIPDLTYGWAKMTGEYLCKIAHRSTGLKSICYRPFSGYGEDQNPAYPFPAIIRRIVKREDPVEIWSNSIRDFVYIDDILNFVRDTMYTIDDGSALNIGTSIPTSFSELVNISSEIAGYSPEVKILENKPLGVYYRVSKTSIDFDVDLREGIRRTINFLTNNS